MTSLKRKTGGDQGQAGGKCRNLRLWNTRKGHGDERERDERRKECAAIKDLKKRYCVGE